MLETWSGKSAKLLRLDGTQATFLGYLRLLSEFRSWSVMVAVAGP